MELKMTEKGFVTQTAFGELHISPEDEHGYRPYQLMVASVASCSASVLRQVLTKMRLNFHDIRVKARVERNEARANRLESIHLHFVIDGEGLRQERVERALALARKNCSMIQSVENSIHITESFEIA